MLSRLAGWSAALVFLNFLIAAQLPVAAQTSLTTLVERVVSCPKCHQPNSATHRFCGECGALLRPDACSRCGEELKAGVKFCTQCGLKVSLGPAASPDPSSTPPPVPSAPPPAPSTEPAIPQEAAAPHIPDSSATNQRLLVAGFSDVNFKSAASGANNAFSLGQFDLFMTSRINDRTGVLAELVTEADEQNKFGTEIERLLLQHSVNEYLNVALGRYHTAIGYYNTAYHHGTWLQTATGRPFLFEFEDGGGILPIHNVGVSLTGRMPGAPASLKYVLEVGNGRSHSGSEPVQNVTDDNGAKAVNAGLVVKPDSMPGFQAGINVYFDRLRGASSQKVGQAILAGHAVYTSQKFEWLNEAVVLRNQSMGTTYTTPAFYTQLARQFGLARPYVRYEWLHAPAAEPFYGTLGLRRGLALGVRYDVNDSACIKLQYDHVQQTGLPRAQTITLQSAFTF